MTFIKIQYLNISAVGEDDFCLIKRDTNMECRPVDSEDEAVWKRHVLGKWLATKLLREHGINVGEFSVREFGKPYIHAAVSFNISHSSDVIVCALSSHGEVGIDIEHMRPLDWTQYEDSFTVQEWKQIKSSTNPAFMLLQYWTKKESLLKADGRGLQVPLASVVLHHDYGMIEGENRKWYLKEISFNQYFCCVSAEFPIQQLSVEKYEPRK